MLPEGRVVPVAAGDAHHRHLQQAMQFHAVQRGEQLALAQVAGGAEQHERIGHGLLGGGAHVVPFFTSWWPPNPARIALSTLWATSPRSRE